MKHDSGFGIKPPPGKNVSENSVEPEPTETLEHLHRELNEWRSEHDAWLEDIDLWQREYRLAGAMLYRMERALPNHNMALEEHAESIRQHKNRVSTYEKSLKNLIGSGNQDAVEYKDLLKEHHLQENQHLNERRHHKSFRDTHLKAIAELMRATNFLESKD